MGSATRRVLVIGFLSLFCALAVLGRSPEPLQRVSIRVYDYAGIPDRVLDGSERELARLFGPLETGVDLVLCYRKGRILDTTCNLPARSNELLVNIVAKVPKGFARWKLSPNSCGFSLLTEEPRENRRATVFLECIQRTAEEVRLSSSVVLAHLVAHEMAHLLLATNEHSTDGLFRARLGIEDWLQASYGRLGFSPEDAVRLRAAVAFRLRPPDAVELAKHGGATPVSASPQ